MKANFTKIFFNRLQLGFILVLFSLTCFAPLSGQVSFNPSDLAGEFLSNPTSLQFGPDDRLYVSQQDGTIYAYSIQRSSRNNYVVTNTELINLVKDQVPNFDDDGTFNSHQERQITGIFVTGTALSPILYVSSSDWRNGAGGGGSDLNLDTNSGVVSRLTWNGSSWDKVDIIRGLPRSEENHAINGLLLDPFDPNILYIAYGGNTNAGSPSSNFAFITEFAYSTAILKVDLAAINSLPLNSTSQYGYSLEWVYNLPTVDDPTRPNVNGINDPLVNGYNGVDPGDPFGGNDGLNQAKIEVNSPVQIHSSGWRNLYDLLITTTPGREGRMYAVDNSANPDWGGHPEGEADYPSEVTTATATNNYIVGEPGSSGPGPGGDPKVNSKNGLHYIRPLLPGELNYVAADPFNNQMYYAGHPNPIRANPSGAGLYTKGSHTLDPNDGDDAFWRTQILPPGDPNFANQSLPVDWPPVPLNMANPAEGDFRNSGETDGALANYAPSTNGICEYTATNFGGAMEGDLIMAGFDGNLFRATLSADGKQVSNCPDTPANCNATVASGFGSQPLDVIAQGDGEIFPGTIWAVTYGGSSIAIFEPTDFDGTTPSPCNANVLDYQLDSDNDGYTDGDENDNSTDPCSAASQPIGDFDQTLINGFLVSNLNDPDDDDDGLLDLDDPFVWDATNGKGLQAPFFNDLFNQLGSGFGGTGLTGLMNNGTTDYLDQFVSNQVILGGTSGLLTIPVITSGDAFVNNLQNNAFQLGVDVSSQTGPFTVSTKINGPFFNNATPVNWQSQGFYIGTGDQSNYLKLVLTANNGVGGFQIFQEIDGSIAPPPNDQTTYSANGLLNAGSIELFLYVDPVSGIVQPQYSLNGGAVNDLGATFVLQGDLLDVVQGNYTINGQPSAMAIGAIATSFNNKPQFAGTWDYFSVTVDNSPSNPILLSSIPDQFNQEGDQPSLAVSATGGSANLNYSASGLPTGLDIEPTNGQIIGIVGNNASTDGPANDGVFPVTITVDDGGINPNATTSFDWTINVPSNTWSQITNTNSHIPRHENSFAQVGDKFYLIGGRETDQVEIYDYNSNTWSGGAVAPSTIHHFQAISYQGYVWAITGFKDNNFPTEQPADNIFLYDPVEDNWIVGPDIPDSRKRGAAGVTLYNNKFYIIGGLQNGHTSGWVNWFDEYDPQTNTWTQLPDAPRARDHFHTTIVGDKLYVVGGRRSGEITTFSPTIPEVDVYDFGSGTWMTSNLPDDLPVPRAGTSTVTFNGQVVVIGGEGGGNAYALSDALDVATGQWSSLDPLNTGRHGTQAIVSGNGIHITSGSPNQGGGNMNNMEVYGVDNPTGASVVQSTLSGPGSFDFGGAAGTTLITLSNTIGNQGIFISSVSLSGPDAGEFAINSGDPNSNIILNPGAYLEINLGFTPSGSGAKSASLVVDYGNGNQLTVALSADVAGSCTWAAGASPVGVKFEAQTAVVNGKMYVFAGFTVDIDILDITEVYDPVLDQWTTLTPMPVPVTHVHNVVVGNEVWFAGGFVGDSPGPTTDVVQIYNTQTDTWSTGPSIPAPRGSVAMALNGNKIHIFGGLLPDRNTNSGEHYVLDLDNQILGWQPLATMPDPRNHHSGIGLNGLIYSIGGQLGHDTANATEINSLHVYDPATDIWTKLANLLTPRSHVEPSTFIHNGQIVIVGGRNGADYLNTVTAYDPVTDQWSDLCTLPVGLIGPGAQVIGDQLIVTNGGLLPLEPQNTTYLTTFITDPQPPIVTAGLNQTITLPSNSIILNGVASDLDGGAISAYLWTQQSGPSTATLSGENTADLTAGDLIAGVYEFRLTVTDDEGDTGFDEVTITVNGANLQGVVSFTLIDASTNQPIAGFDPIADGASINLTVIGTDQFNIRANTNPSMVGSVMLNLAGFNGGSDNIRTENVAPYALFGDGAGNYNSWAPSTPQEGFSYTLSATAFDQRNGAGSLVGSLTISFSFTDQGGASLPPTASSGGNQGITFPTSSITLNGSGNDPDGGAIAGYQWSQQSGPNTATLSNENTEDLSASNLTEGTYVFRLTVTDDEGDTGFDDATVTVATGQPPVVNAGGDQVVTLPTNSITLNGSGNDPDGGAIASYQWSQQSGPNTATLANENTADLTTSNLIAGTYVFRLTLTDDEGATNFDEATVTVNTQLPVANAGVDQNVTLPVNNLTLNGSGNDPDGGSIATYLWIQQSGPSTATLSGDNTPDLTAGNLIEGTYVFRLTVTDDEGETGFDDVQVIVNPVISQQGVVSFTLINTETDQPISIYDPIPDGAVIDLSLLVTDQLNIRANTNPSQVGSVTFTLQGFNGGSDNNRAENGAPYALFGDAAGNYGPWVPAPPVAGYNYNLTGTAFEQSNARGSVIGSLTISFSFTDQGGVANNPPTVQNPGTQNNAEGDIISLAVTGDDGDGGIQSLTYTANNLPPGLSINANTGLISGTLQTSSSSGGGFSEVNGLVIVEVESVGLVNNWTQGTDGNITYYEAALDNFNDPATGGLINYDINITSPGIYRFEWRSKINSGNSGTDSNDNWLKFPNNGDVVFFGYQGTVTSETQLDTDLQSETNIVFPIGSGLEGAQTTPSGAGDDGFFKVFMNSVNGWFWSSKTSDNDGHQIYVKFVNAGIYTMQLSNRSAGHAIDRFALYKIDTYGNNYSDTELTNAPASSGGTGAAANSPYQVEITVIDDGIPNLSSSIIFTWNVNPEPPETANLETDNDIIIPGSDVFSNKIAKVYPNPASHFFNVEIEIMEEDMLVFSLFSVTGREIGLGEFKTAAGKSILKFNTRDLNLSAGGYYLKIESIHMKSVIHYKLLLE